MRANGEIKAIDAKLKAQLEAEDLLRGNRGGTTPVPGTGRA